MKRTTINGVRANRPIPDTSVIAIHVKSVNVGESRKLRVQRQLPFVTEIEYEID